jgi:hypothetical protein
MKVKIIIILFFVTPQCIYSQISQEGKEFIKSLTWDVPFKATRLGAYNKLNNEKNRFNRGY